ncbi:MAG: hypothetical protein ILNGONEN_00750 [Syntrophorhabdaceae bacterium]|nr:hypothetical protein [Syntrophorhabdaceae bacterium]
MSQGIPTQAVGQRTPTPALPRSSLQHTSRRISYPLHLPTQTPQQRQSVEKAQQKQNGLLKPQGGSPKLLNDGLAYSNQSQLVAIWMNRNSPFVGCSLL